MTWTIEISLIDIICRGIVGVGTIVVFILILIDQRKTRKFLEEELGKRESKDE